mgnify:CR=1 FL=1
MLAAPNAEVSGAIITSDCMSPTTEAGAYGAYAAADGDYPELKLHFVDVGQGDCTIIELPDGGTMIIDGGDYAQKYADAIARPRHRHRERNGYYYENNQIRKYYLLSGLPTTFPPTCAACSARKKR